MPSQYLKVGVIGIGRIAQAAHLPALTKAEGVRLVGISDPNRFIVDTVAEHYSVPGFTDPALLLAEDVDAVIVAAPDRFHLPLAMHALKAGKHVLVEKPIGLTVTEGQALVDMAAERGLLLQVGSMRRHDPGIAFAKAHLASIGPIMSAQYWYRVMNTLRTATEDTFFPPIVMDPGVRATENSFKAERSRYLLLTHGAHVFDTMRNLSGDLSSVQVCSTQVGTDYSWHGIGRLANTGGLLSFELSANVHSTWSEGFDLFGSKGSIEIRTPFPFTRQASTVRVFTEDTLAAAVPEFGAADPYRRQLEYFAQAIAQGLPAYPDGADGVKAVRLMDAVAASATVGSRVVV